MRALSLTEPKLLGCGVAPALRSGAQLLRLRRVVPGLAWAQVSAFQEVGNLPDFLSLPIPRSGRGASSQAETQAGSLRLKWRVRRAPRSSSLSPSIK